MNALITANGITPRNTKFETDKEKLRRTIRAAVLETLTQNAQNAAKAAEKPLPGQEYPRSIRSCLERAKATVNAPKQGSVQRMVDIAAKKAGGKGKGNKNRLIKERNRLLKIVRHRIAELGKWVKEKSAQEKNQSINPICSNPISYAS